jgi:hypothetical protein
MGESISMKIELELNENNEVIGWHDDLKDAKNPYESTDDELPSIIGKIYKNGVLSEKPLTLTEMKTNKLAEIKTAKKLYQNRDVVSKINGKNYNFFGGLESARKYKDAMDLGVALGVTEGTIRVVEGLVSITEIDMKTTLGKLSLQVYKGWLKESYYAESIKNATTQEQLDLIVWEDERNG